MLRWTDIHCHLNFLEITPYEAIHNAKNNGVERLITIGTEPGDLDIVQELADRYYPEVYCTLGIHPHEAKLNTAQIERKIRAESLKKEVVAIGEIGLDYFYLHSDIETQKKVFKEYLQIALENDLPVEIHTRDAEEDTIEILKSFGEEFRGVIHCFTGTDFLAQESLELGLDISVSGIATFKNARDLRATIEKVPLDRLHVETDSPFLAPVPHRGKKNEPAFVIHTAEMLAELKGVSLEDLNAQVEKNNQRVFSKMKSWS